ncbi:MAG: YHS domain protein [Leptospirales bacterium]|nr:YHS domain protein [Leptospirales bacterium]
MNRKINKKIIVIAAIFILAGAGAAIASKKKISPIGWGWFGKVYTRDGLALEGYDPVTYHTEGKPKKGSPAYAMDWNGSTLLFSTAENKTAFEKDPAKYAPAFGGFCSFAASKGFTAKADPTAWKIEGRKLYLFNDAEMRENWISELEKGVIGRAEMNWAKRPE